MKPALLVIVAAAVGIAGVAVAAYSPSSLAQAWPSSRPVRIVSGFAPGGATDVAARVAAQKLTESLGQSVVVENRPGASGMIAAEMIARGAPDGYSMYLANATLATPSLFAHMPFDITRDFAFVSLVGMGPSVLVVHPSLPVRNVKELLALARSRPGTLNFASGGTGNITHLAMELLISMTHIKMTHVPYKGGAPSTVATVSGETQLMFSSIASALTQIQERRLRALGVSSLHRSAALPQVPTINEAGVPGYDASSWYGLVMAAATPAAIVNRLSGDMMKALAGSETRERLAGQGIDPVTGGTEEFRKYVSAEIPKWAKVIREAGIPPQ